jgi:hypothetical protein
MCVLPALFLFIAAPIGAQTHCDVHHRWQEKIDATHLSDASTTTTVSAMLSWASPAFTAAETYWCQPRNTGASREIPTNRRCSNTRLGPGG